MATANKNDKDKTQQANNTERGHTPLLSDVLPLPDPRFHGRIGSTYVDSEADIISLPMPPAGAPNVLLVLLDDVGFGQTSTFGGPANTPTLQRLANEGLRYNRFHTTALCSPTREDYGPHKNELTGRVPGVEITIAAAAESSDQL